MGAGKDAGLIGVCAVGVVVGVVVGEVEDDDDADDG